MPDPDAIPSTSLDGQTAVVTGAAQGIGLAIARQLKHQGARIVGWDIDGELMAQAAGEIGANTTALQVDVTDFAQVKEAAERSLARGTSVEILVCNAGISGLNAPLIDYPLDEWHKVIDLDLNSVFYCTKCLLGHMRANGYGRVINIASVAGKEGNPNAAAYSAAKAGVIALTKSLAKEHCDLDIAVNCVTPAAARTAIFKQMTREHRDMMLSKIPRGRFVYPAEVAALVGWLATPACSFSTGAVFDVTGGRSTY